MPGRFSEICCAPRPPFQVVTSSQPNNDAAKRENQNVTYQSDVTDPEGGIERNIHSDDSPVSTDVPETQPCPQCGKPLRTVVGGRGVYCVSCRYTALRTL